MTVNFVFEFIPKVDDEDPGKESVLDLSLPVVTTPRPK